MLQQRLRQIDAMDWPTTLDLMENPTMEEVRLPSGEVLRVKTYGYWDMGPISDFYVRVRVYSDRGLRRWFPYKASTGRAGEEIEALVAGEGAHADS